jgi:hypothetical protein
VVTNFLTHSSLLSQLKIKYWSLLRQRTLFSFTPQYTTFNIVKYISHFETVTILSSTSGLGSSAFLLNFNNIVNYESLNMLVWQLEDIFNTAHTNLCDWLRMLCLRASDNVWIDLSQVMTRQNVFINTGFPQNDYYIVLILVFLVEFCIIFLSTFILPSSIHIYHADLWWQKHWSELNVYFQKTECDHSTEHDNIQIYACNYRENY